MLLLDAVFINNSGGKVLLDYLVKKLETAGINPFYLLDKRCEESYINDIPTSRKEFVEANLYSRNTFYKRNSYRFTKIFCFGNVPPTLALKVPVYTYFHNVSLFNYPATYSLKEKFLKSIKSKIISFFSKNTTYFIVQTEDVKALLLKSIKFPEDKCVVVPFFNLMENRKGENKDNSFAYVSNGNTHKNHLILIQAWYELASKNLFPELHLTITDNYIELISLIDVAKSKGLRINNHGFTDAYRLYASTKYLIYPSLCESFGLGLIEAAASGCNVIASDLPYVYEVVKPTATFDPNSSKSISKSVEEVLSGKNNIRTELIVENKIQELLELIRT